MKDMFGREISVGDTIAYSGVNSTLSIYTVVKVMGPAHKTATGVTALKWFFTKDHPDGYELSYRAVALVNDASRYMKINKADLPIKNI